MVLGLGKVARRYLVATSCNVEIQLGGHLDRLGSPLPLKGQAGLAMMNPLPPQGPEQLRGRSLKKRAWPLRPKPETNKRRLPPQALAAVASQQDNPHRAVRLPSAVRSQPGIQRQRLLHVPRTRTSSWPHCAPA